MKDILLTNKDNKILFGDSQLKRDLVFGKYKQYNPLWGNDSHHIINYYFSKNRLYKLYQFSQNILALQLISYDFSDNIIRVYSTLTQEEINSKHIAPKIKYEYDTKSGEKHAIDIQGMHDNIIEPLHISSDHKIEELPKAEIVYKGTLGSIIEYTYKGSLKYNVISANNKILYPLGGFDKYTIERNGVKLINSNLDDAYILVQPNNGLVITENGMQHTFGEFEEYIY